MKLTEKDIADYFGYTADTIQKWKKVLDPIRKEKLQRRYNALKSFYIKQLDNDS